MLYSATEIAQELFLLIFFVTLLLQVFDINKYPIFIKLDRHFV